MDKLYTDLQVVDHGESWQYRVDAVRESLDDNGLKRQQRLAAGRYPSQSEAEEHQAELDAALAETGWGDLGAQLRDQPYEPTGYHLAVQSIGDDVEQDGAHLALIAYSGAHVSSTTLAHGDERTLERYAASLEDVQAERGDAVLLVAARHLALGQGTIAPDAPLFADDIGSAETAEHQPQYYFGYGVGENNRPSLEAVKTWVADGSRRFDTLTINEYDSYEDAAVDEYILETSVATDGLERALNIAERWSEANGYLDPDRDDPRIFFAGDAPPDSFTTNRERDVPQYQVGANGEQLADESVSLPEPADYVYRVEFDDAGNMDFVPREPVENPHWRMETLPVNDPDGAALGVIGSPAISDDAPQYQVGAISANGEHYVDAVKSWGVDGQYERLAIPQPTWEAAQEQASLAQAEQADGDLQSALRRVERLAEDAGVLDPERMDGRLFTQGPPDRFETSRQQDLRENPFLYDNWPPSEAVENPMADFNPFTDETPQPAPVGDPMADFNPFADEMPQPVENPHWRFDTLPVNDPDGAALGVSLQMVRYPTVEARPGVIGSPAISDDAPIEMLEVAHFTTQDAADRFVDEFAGYVDPDVISAPELAEEVARMEGHPVVWRGVNGDELAAYEDLTLTLTRDRDDWRPHDEPTMPHPLALDDGHVSPDLDL